MFRNNPHCSSLNRNDMFQVSSLKNIVCKRRPLRHKLKTLPQLRQLVGIPLSQNETLKSSFSDHQSSRVDMLLVKTC